MIIPITNKIYIILPVYNRRETTQEFIECLLAQTYQNYHLILVDDGSTDGTEDMVRSKVRSLTVIRGQGDWWWAGGLQQGINWIHQNNVKESDIVLMANDDITFDQFFLEKAVNSLNNQPHSLLITQVFGVESGRLFSMLSKANVNNLTFTKANSPEEINCCDTRALFLKYADLVRVGNFHPRFLPHYLSDCEFTLRASRKGIKILIHNDLKAFIDEKIQFTEAKYFENASFPDFISRCFSNKYPCNPLAWSSFAILVSPKQLIPLNLLRVWKGAIYRIVGYGWYCLLGNKNAENYFA